MADADHLNASARAALALSLEARKDYLRGEHWIGYPRAKQILALLEELFTHPKTHRMPGLLIVGDTNAGKTMIATRFVQQHPADDNPKGDTVKVPVLAIQAPPGPNEGRFYDGILRALSAPYNSNDRIASKQFQVLHLLKQIGLRMLMIDEIHNILSGPVNQQRQFLNVLKYLSNDLCIPLVGLGTKEALRAIQADPQLANRFEPAPLPRWHLDQDFLRLLASFEQVLPLHKPSRLIEERLARRLLALSEGNLGALARLLRTAAIHAVETGIEQIDEQVLSALHWTPPSQRRRQAERLV